MSNLLIRLQRGSGEVPGTPFPVTTGLAGECPMSRAQLPWCSRLDDGSPHQWMREPSRSRAQAYHASVFKILELLLGYAPVAGGGQRTCKLVLGRYRDQYRCRKRVCRDAVQATGKKPHRARTRRQDEFVNRYPARNLIFGHLGSHLHHDQRVATRRRCKPLRQLRLEITRKAIREQFCERRLAEAPQMQGRKITER